MAPCEHCSQEHEASVIFCPSTGRLIPSHLLPQGTLLEGKYRIDRTLGVGGMGAVFEARHVLLDKRVAVKVMLPDPAAEEAMQLSARMTREARAASATGHRNIAQVTDMGWASKGTLFVVMEYLEGRTLKQLLDEEGHLPVPRAASLMLQVLAGLDVVHRKGIVHRDLKPENLMLTRDDADEELVKILDFGISKVINAEQSMHLTTPGLVMGTPQYMSPEQARNAAEIDLRTDIYSAGAILYRMVTGTLPHERDTLSASIAATLTAPVDPPSQRRPGLSPRLDRIVLRALAKQPGERYPDARAFRDALAPFTDPDAAQLPTETPGLSLAADLDPSKLVHLDEVGPEPAAGPQPPPTAPVAAAAPSAGPALAAEHFQAPEADVEQLELAAPTTTPHRETSQPRVVAPPPGDPEPLAKLRTTGVYGQARRSQARPGLWLALAAAVLAGGWGWWYLRGQETGGQPAPGVLQTSQKVQIRIDVYPRWAEVQVDGVALTSQPLVLERSSREYTVSAKAEGYWSETVSFKPEEDRTLLIELKPRKPSP